MLHSDQGVRRASLAWMPVALFGYALSKSWIRLASPFLAESRTLIPHLNFDLLFTFSAVLIAVLSLAFPSSRVKRCLLPVSILALIASSVMMLLTLSFPETSEVLGVAVRVTGAFGVMGMAVLWTDLYALLNPARAAFFAAGSVVLSWGLCYLVELNPPYRLLVIMVVFALLAWWAYSQARREVRRELPADDVRTCDFTVPYRAIIFIGAYSFAFGLISHAASANIDGASQFRIIPAAVVLILLFVDTKRFSLKVLYNIAFPTMACGILLAALLPGMPLSASTLLIDISYAAMNLMVTVVACTISYASNKSALWVFGLFVTTQYACKQVGLWVRSLLATGVDASVASGITALLAILLIAIASLVMLSEKSVFSQWGGTLRSEKGVAKTDRMGIVRTRIDDLSSSYQLTQREIEVLHLIAEGKSNRGIAQDMFIAEGTVKAHVQHIYQKLDVHSRKELLLLLGVEEAAHGE